MKHLGASWRRQGGAWRFINRDAEGNEYAFHRFYHPIASPKCVVQTFEYEGEPGCISLETSQLEEQSGKTLMTKIAPCQSVEDRDAMIQSGMEWKERRHT
ncbi:MAG: SRPBCC domain-containing protein [Chloroflexi bacterium]|nr:SRPBCC domain-containing protein [Chloroflexota bacterium]